MKNLSIIAFYLFALTFAMSIHANGNGSYSGSHAGAKAGSQAGAIGTIDQSTNIVEGDDLDEAVPSVFSAGVTAGGSNPCIVSIGGGVGVSGFGINLAKAYNDIECQVRESLRLMAAVSVPNETGNQILMREVACQSTVYWDAMERTYLETQDERYYCSNERPNEAEESLAFRRRGSQPPEETAVTVISSPEYASYEDSTGEFPYE